MCVPPPPSRLALIRGWQRDAWRQLCLPPAALTSPTGYEGACLGQGVLLQVFAEEGRGEETPALPLTLCLQRGRLEPPLAKRPQVAVLAPEEKRLCKACQAGPLLHANPAAGTKAVVSHHTAVNPPSAAIWKYGQRRGPSPPVWWNSPNFSPHRRPPPAA